MAMWSVFGIIGLLIALISILLPVALVVALQVWLCRRKTRWLGLILPGLSFLFSLLLVFSVGTFGLINQGGQRRHPDPGGERPGDPADHHGEWHDHRL